MHDALKMILLIGALTLASLPDTYTRSSSPLSVSGSEGYGGAAAPLLPPPAAGELRLTICTRVRNEAPYLREWIEYHRILGFEDFLLMDDGSTDDTRCILEAYAEQGVVRMMSPKWGRDQKDVFDACRDVLQSEDDAERTWMATHDVDEFMWYDTERFESVKDAIKDQRGQSLLVPRLLFGTSNHTSYSPGSLVIERFTHRFDPKGCDEGYLQQQQNQSRQNQRRLFDHENMVSYCDYNLQMPFDGPKSMSLVSALATHDCPRNERCIGNHHHRLEGTTSPSNSSIRKGPDTPQQDERFVNMKTLLPSIALFHYMTKSRHEFYDRLCHTRWLDKYYKCETCSPEVYFNIVEGYANNFEDTRLLKYTERLRKVLNETSTGLHCSITGPEEHSLESYRSCWAESMARGRLWNSLLFAFQAAPIVACAIIIGWWKRRVIFKGYWRYN